MRRKGFRVTSVLTIGFLSSATETRLTIKWGLVVVGQRRNRSTTHAVAKSIVSSSR